MIENIIFDFDGVILNSVPVKTKAFRQLFKNFPDEVVDKFIAFHIANGGISRYEKINFFYEKLLNEVISKENIAKYAKEYSQLTKEILSNPIYLLEDTVKFIRKNFQKYNMHIASGADEQDLRYICKKLNLVQYFKSIDGSPQKKSDIIKEIIITNKYHIDTTILIGDSVNDYEAAMENGIKFIGYNNDELKVLKNTKYLNKFENFLELL